MGDSLLLQSWLVDNGGSAAPSAYTSYAHYCVKETVKILMKELEQDPTGLNTKSKGFLELW
jgi:hypothetical protein